MITVMNARAIGGDAAGFGRVWKLFEFAFMAAAGEKGKSEEEERKEGRRRGRVRF